MCCFTFSIFVKHCWRWAIFLPMNLASLATSRFSSSFLSKIPPENNEDISNSIPPKYILPICLINSALFFFCVDGIQFMTSSVFYFSRITKSEYPSNNKISVRKIGWAPIFSRNLIIFSLICEILDFLGDLRRDNFECNIFRNFSRHFPCPNAGLKILRKRFDKFLAHRWRSFQFCTSKINCWVIH